MLILGIDDAGRGPLIGPMILAGVLINKDQEKIIKQSGATDSKLLYHNQRIELSKIIKENSINSKVIKVYPDEIDAALNSESNNLNKLEAHFDIILPKRNKSITPNFSILSERNKVLIERIYKEDINLWITLNEN